MHKCPLFRLTQMRQYVWRKHLSHMGSFLVLSAQRRNRRRTNPAAQDLPLRLQAWRHDHDLSLNPATGDCSSAVPFPNNLNRLAILFRFSWTFLRVRESCTEHDWVSAENRRRVESMARLGLSNDEVELMTW